MKHLEWQLRERRAGNDYRVFKTGFADGVNPRTGSTTTFSLIECPDWVNVLALTADEQVVMLRQYRPGIDKVCLEIPGGMIDPGEDPVAAGLRELAEETGYSGGVAELIGSVAPNPALQNNRLHTVLVRGVEKTGEPTPEEGEVLEVHTQPLASVYAAIKRGDIEHALVIVAFMHLKLT